MIHRSLRKYRTTWEAISERIINVNMCVHEYRLTVMVVYAVNYDESVNT